MAGQAVLPVSARFYADLPLHAGESVQLPAHAARHVQVLRLQPGEVITLFNNQGGEFEATIERMGRSEVAVRLGAHSALEREAARPVHLVLGMPANERMDWLVEKASELGVASITPLMTERAVLRLKGERAEKKLGHWQGVAIAACEQCGRNRLPLMHGISTFGDWAAALAPPTPGVPRLLLSLRAGSQPLASALALYPGTSPATLLSGPEGGLSPAEEDVAMRCGFVPVTLGTRILRAETAPLICLALLTLGYP